MFRGGKGSSVSVSETSSSKEKQQAHAARLYVVGNDAEGN